MKKVVLFMLLVMAGSVFAGDWDLKTLDKAIRKNKWDPELYAERGQYYYEHGLYEKAMDDYMKAYGLRLGVCICWAMRSVQARC